MVGVVVRSSNPGDCEPAFAVWRAAETARRGGPPPSTSEQRVRGYVRRAGAVLLVADAASEVVGMALLAPTTSRPTGISALQIVHYERLL